MTQKSKLRLTDKEIEALGKKMAEKKNTAAAKAFEALAAENLPEAKSICAQLKKLPEKVLDALYTNRYSRSQFTPGYVAMLLTGKSDDRENRTARASDFESEIILAAHDCKTLGELCKKLGI